MTVVAALLVPILRLLPLFRASEASHITNRRTFTSTPIKFEASHITNRRTFTSTPIKFAAALSAFAMGNRAPASPPPRGEANDEKVGGSSCEPYPYDVRTPGYRVWLMGDSVIDNSYWNGVERDSTPEVLRRILARKGGGERVEVLDRSAEEIDALTMLRICRDGEGGGRFRVGSHYVRHREDIGTPYDPPSGLVDVNPTFGPRDFAVLSVGGNDFALRRETDPKVILGLVRDLVRHYVREGGVRPERFFYVSPYPPTLAMSAFTFLVMGKNLGSLYEQYLREADIVCGEEGITHISLGHFTKKERADPGTLIPEPTPKGARDLAVLIQRAVLKQIEREEVGAGATR